MICGLKLLLNGQKKAIGKAIPWLASVQAGKPLCSLFWKRRRKPIWLSDSGKDQRSCHVSHADELNARPRKKLGYATPEELFDAFLDRVYSVGSKPA